METLSRAKAIRMISSIDMVGMTLCVDTDNGTYNNPVSDHLIAILSFMRRDLCKAYGLTINPLDSIQPDFFVKHLTPAESAELMLDEMDEEMS
jgi:hypothetical protein